LAYEYIFSRSCPHGKFISQPANNKGPKEFKKLFLVHGEYDVQQVFRSKLLKMGFSTIETPELHQEYII